LCIDENTRNIINSRLHGLPYLSSIIPLCDCQTRLHFDQYGGNISIGREVEVEESTVYEILLGTQVYPQFETQIVRLEELLLRYPEYRTQDFGRNLIGSFFSRYSELEVFDALKRSGYEASIDPLIAPGIRDSKKADFKISINEADIYIELITPRLTQPEEELFQEEPVAGFYDPTVGIVNHHEEFHPVEWKIIQEYTHHFKIYEPEFATPTIFIADLTYAYSIAGIFGTMDFGSLFARYSFPDYVVGILVYRTIYHRSRSTKISTLYVNPRFSGASEIPEGLSHIMDFS